MAGHGQRGQENVAEVFGSKLALPAANSLNRRSSSSQARSRVLPSWRSGAHCAGICSKLCARESEVGFSEERGLLGREALVRPVGDFWSEQGDR